MARYRVQGNGKAPAGLQAGDEVVTGGGTDRILGVNADGSYRSSLSNKYQTIYNYRGSYGTPSAGQTDAAQVRTRTGSVPCPGRALCPPCHDFIA